MKRAFSRIFILVIILGVLVISSAFAALPYPGKCAQMGFEQTETECILPDGTTCPLEEFEEGTCGMRYQEDFCLGQGALTWGKTECCGDMEPYLSPGMLGQSTCQCPPIVSTKVEENLTAVKDGTSLLATTLLIATFVVMTLVIYFTERRWLNIIAKLIQIGVALSLLSVFTLLSIPVLLSPVFLLQFLGYSSSHLTSGISGATPLNFIGVVLELGTIIVLIWQYRRERRS